MAYIHEYSTQVVNLCTILLDISANVLIQVFGIHFKASDTILWNNCKLSHTIFLKTKNY